MTPRPDRRSDSRPDRGARRPGGGASGRPPGRGSGRPGGPQRGPAGRRPRWGAGDTGEAGDRPRPRRDGFQPQGEWTPRGPEGEGGGRRFDGPRPDASRFERPRFGDRRAPAGRPPAGRAPGGRPPGGRGPAGRADERGPDRRPERGGRFERRPDQGRPARPFAAPGSDAGAPPRFLPRGAARPRPPAELMGQERRFAGPGPRGLDAPEGENFAGAAPSDLIWGRHSAQAALESGRPIHRIWCTPEMRFSPRFLQLLREAKSGGVLVEEVTWARLGQISGGAVHQGIVLQPAAAETLDLPSLIDGCRGIGEAPLLIAVDGLTDPQNLGAIVRSAEALGAHGLVLPQRRNAGLTGSVAKVAAGALEHLPVARVVNLNRSLEALKDEGYRVIGLASEGSVCLEEADLDGPLVVVTGSEGDGLSLLTRRHCDQLVRIPLRGTTPSLNASVATALLLYEIARRGWMQGLRGSSPAPRLVRPALPFPSPVEATATVGSPEPDEASQAVSFEPPAEAAALADSVDSAPELPELQRTPWDACVDQSSPQTAVDSEAAATNLDAPASGAWSAQVGASEARGEAPEALGEAPDPDSGDDAITPAPGAPSPWASAIARVDEPAEPQAPPSFEGDIRL